MYAGNFWYCINVCIFNEDFFFICTYNKRNLARCSVFLIIQNLFMSDFTRAVAVTRMLNIVLTLKYLKQNKNIIHKYLFRFAFHSANNELSRTDIGHQSNEVFIKSANWAIVHWWPFERIFRRLTIPIKLNLKKLIHMTT